MLFVSCSVGRQRNPLALVPKKSIAVQARRQSSAGIVPISDGSGASVTASPSDQALPTVAPMPSIGQTNVGAQGTPLGVMEQPVMVVIPLSTTGQTGLPIALVVPTVVGAT